MKPSQPTTITVAIFICCVNLLCAQNGFTNKEEAKNFIDANGLKQDKWIEYEKHNKITTTDKAKYYFLRVYKDNKLIEMERGYYISGELYLELPYTADGKINGVGKEYYKSGELFKEYPYINGKENGVEKWYKKNGKQYYWKSFYYNENGRLVANPNLQATNQNNNNNDLLLVGAAAIIGYEAVKNGTTVNAPQNNNASGGNTTNNNNKLYRECLVTVTNSTHCNVNLDLITTGISPKGCIVELCTGIAPANACTIVVRPQSNYNNNDFEFTFKATFYVNASNGNSCGPGTIIKSVSGNFQVAPSSMSVNLGGY